MIHPMYVEIGAMLRKQRDRIGMTQADLAAHLGLSRTSVTNIERGRQPMLVHQLFQAANALGIDAVEVLRRLAATSERSGEGEEAAKVDALLERLNEASREDEP